MIMEDFVPFDLSIKLKEKGFREKCLMHYTNIGGLYLNSIDTYYRPNQELDYTDFLGCLNLGNNIGLIDAPTISQVLKWLREEKKIHIEVVFGCCGFCWDLILNIKYVEGYNNSEWDVLDCEKYAEINNQENHSTYEQAAIAAIEYVIDNLI